MHKTTPNAEVMVTKGFKEFVTNLSEKICEKLAKKGFPEIFTTEMPCQVFAEIWKVFENAKWGKTYSESNQFFDDKPVMYPLEFTMFGCEVNLYYDPPHSFGGETLRVVSSWFKVRTLKNKSPSKPFYEKIFLRIVERHLLENAVISILSSGESEG